MTTFDNQFGQGPTRKKNRLIWLIAAVILVVVLVGGGGIVAYAQFDVFKSTKLIYLQSEIKQTTGAQQALSKALDTYSKEMEPMLNKPVHSLFEISDLTLDMASSDAKTKAILDFIKKSKLSVDAQQDNSAQKQVYNIKWTLDNAAFLDVETAIDPERLAVRIPAFYDKYAYVNVKDLESLRKEFNSSNIPKKVLTYNDVMAAVSIKKDELEKALLPYAKLYADNLQESQFQLVKDGLMNEENANIKSREITITFSQEDVKRMVNSLSDKLAADTVLQDIIFTRAKNMAQLLNDSGYPTEAITQEKFTNSWKDFADKMKKSSEKGDLGDGGKMIVYINNDHDILERKLMFHVKENGKNNEVVLKAASWEDKEFPQHLLLAANVKEEQGATTELKLLNTSNLDAKGGKGKLTLNVNETGSKSAATAGTLLVDYDLSQTNEKQSGTYTFKLSGSGEAEGTMEGKITSSSEKKGNATDANYDISLTFKDVKVESDLKALAFKLHSKQETGVEVKLPAYTKDNSLDVTHMTDQDRTQFMMDLMAGAQKFMETHKDLLQNLGIPLGGMLPGADDYGYGYEDEEFPSDWDLNLDTDSLQSELADSLQDLTPEQQEALLEALKSMEKQGLKAK
ncbi:hypothetical protein LOZ80_26485 [Paenibacillus sp. HWE-109]|uniref:DUF6583 family protein n=1 Tax=Paenibacillus sp. HWE-109 TaxID=1306526 RepID=UPI001EDE8ACB|nr:DUF6583 family protein [Paenibacillus sp. HWE-109]UKS25124.1 hypothetical protein LOZ80_26485 [Paenibacillus sp. HWE-109]